jgi:hypothetical protein
LAIGPLELADFVSDAFEDLHVDDPTPIEEHTVAFRSSTSTDDGPALSSSLHTRALVKVVCIPARSTRRDGSPVWTVQSVQGDCPGA